MTPLHAASSKGHTEIIRLILSVVEEKNPKNDKDRTPLHQAAYSGHADIVRIILDAVEYKTQKIMMALLLFMLLPLMFGCC